MADEGRRARGREWFEHVTRMTPPPGGPPFMAEGLLDFVFSEVWSRSGLDTRSRRWISLTCVCAAASVPGIEAHVYAALKSGDVTIDEMNEFLLHFATYAGWPKAATAQPVVAQAWARVQAEGGPDRRETPAGL